MRPGLLNATFVVAWMFSAMALATARVSVEQVTTEVEDSTAAATDSTPRFDPNRFSDLLPAPYVISRLPVEWPAASSLARERVSDVDGDLDVEVLEFFEARESARTLVSALPDETFDVSHGGLPEIRQCMAFELASTVLARSLVEAGENGTRPAAELRDHIARLHVAIVDRMAFPRAMSPSSVPRQNFASAVGIPNPRSESTPPYTFTRGLGDDRVPALAALLWTFGRVVATSPHTFWRDSLLRAFPAVADLVANYSKAQSGWEALRHSCRQIAFERLGPLYYLDAVLVEDTPETLERSLTAGRPVHAKLRNAGARPIAGRLSGMLISEPLNSESWNPRIEALLEIDFRIAAAASQKIAINISRIVERERSYVLLLDPSNSYVPTFAWFAGPPIQLQTCVAGSTLSRRTFAKNSIEQVLLAYAADASTDFSTLAKEDKMFGTVMDHPHALSVPGALSTTYIPAPWGNSLVSTMYRGDSLAKGQQIFDRLTARVRNICGRNIGAVDRRGDAPFGVKASLVMKTFSRDASLMLTLGQWPDDKGQAEVRVDLTIGAQGVVE